MASSSSFDKNLEKKRPDPTLPTPAKYVVPSHKSLPMAAIESMREMVNWREKFYFTYDEEKIRRVYEIQQNMDFDDLLSYVMYGDGEEVVWDGDVWNTQYITRATEHQETKGLKSEPKKNVAAEKPYNGNLKGV